MLISENHFAMRRQKPDFHVLAVHFLHTKTATSINLICCFLTFVLRVIRFPRRQSSGCSGKLTPIIPVSTPKCIHLCTLPCVMQKGTFLFVTLETGLIIQIYISVVF